MNGFYITVKNNLLEPKHIKAMGGDRNVGTIWLFLWLLDKMTIIDHEKGEGKVLGGRPIRYEDIEKDLGISRATYKRWIDMLRKNGYITTIRSPYGLIITVHKAFKVFNQRSIMGEPSNKNRRLVGEPSPSHLRAISTPIGEPSNKTIHYNTKDNRGLISKNKEKIREAIKTGNFKSLKS